MVSAKYKQSGGAIFNVEDGRTENSDHQADCARSVIFEMGLCRSYRCETVPARRRRRRERERERERDPLRERWSKVDDWDNPQCWNEIHYLLSVRIQMLRDFSSSGGPFGKGVKSFNALSPISLQQTKFTKSPSLHEYK